MSEDVGKQAIYVDGKFVDYVMPPEFAEFDAAVERFTSTAPSSRHPAELPDDMRVLRHWIDQLELAFSRRAAEFAATDQYDRLGSASAEDWIRHDTKMSGAAASAALRVGEEMHALPEFTAAVRDGRIGFGHMALAARLRAAVCRDDQSRPFDEKPLLELALAHSVGRFSFDCAHARHAIDKEGFLSDQLTAVEWRAFEMLPCDDGVILRGRLDKEGAAMLRAALDPLAKKGGAEDTRRKKRRDADALIEMSNHCLDSGTLPSHGGQRPHVQVTTTLETIMNLVGAPAGEMNFTTPLAAATVQRLTCDAGITRVLFDSKSTIIDIGRSRRVPSAPMRRALQARDKGCAWPGCDRPPSWTDAHHVKHWSQNGVTEMANLALLCYRHHWLVHEGGWQLVWSPDERLLPVRPIPGTRPTACGELAPTDAEEEARARAEAHPWDVL